MYITRLRLTEFRNYAQQEMFPAARLNILVGSNGQGKTNLLEAVYMLATTRSLRHSHDSELVRHSAQQARIELDVVRSTMPDCLLEMEVTPTERKIVKIDGSRRTRAIDIFGQLSVVSFSAADLGIVGGDPSQRRRFLNLEVSQFSPRYVYAFAAYKKALEQRNKLLKVLRDRPTADSGIEAWNEQLVAHGTPIIEKRREFLENLAPIANEIHYELTGGNDGLSVEYEPDIKSGAADVADAFRRQLESRRRDELRRGVTLAGPQRDDMALRIGEMDARLYGSAGQQRTVALSLRLAQFRLMCDRLGEAPIMLLDDVLSDLDDSRRTQLLKRVQQDCQTFITCTNLRAFGPEMRSQAAVFHVHAGALQQEPGDAGICSGTAAVQAVVQPA